MRSETHANKEIGKKCQPVLNSLLDPLLACHSSLSTATATKPFACLPENVP